MNRIIICEDNSADLKKLSELISAYLAQKNDTLTTVTAFDDPEKILDHVEGSSEPMIFILDIMMPQASGIEIGKAIRKSHPESIIIYATSSKEYALDAFGVLAQRYLLKPLEKEQLFEALDFAFKQIETTTDRRFSLRTPQGIISVPFNDVLYVECASRMIDLHCVDGSTYRSLFIRKNFESEIAPLLDDPRFVQTHKSFAVHMGHIEQLSSLNLVLDNGFVAPIARKRQGEVKRRYLKFLSEQS